MLFSDIIRQGKEGLLPHYIYFKHKHKRLPDFERGDLPSMEIYQDYPNMHWSITLGMTEMWAKNKTNSEIADYLAEKGF